MSGGGGGVDVRLRVLREGGLWARPRTANQLHGWLSGVLGVRVPRSGLREGSDAPFDYLCHAFFEAGERDDVVGGGSAPGDAVVWAARGAGKTFYAAVATVLDLVFKPGVQVKVLGGSLDQSKRMHEHLSVLLDRPVFGGLVGGVEGKAVTERRVRLANGSVAEVLAQSHTSVRGTRPHKLRCDEVELFDRSVWEAAQLTTRSGVVRTAEGDLGVGGVIEALSTHHVAGGLMAGLVKGCGGEGGRRVFRWSVVDVLESCGPERVCEGCGLAPECGGRAKVVEGLARPRGHVTVADALVAKGRAGSAAWRSEMLCEAPDRGDAVLPEFEAGVHVREGLPEFEEPVLVAGMDFGYRSPTVVVFAVTESDRVIARRRASRARGGVGFSDGLGVVRVPLHVVAEHEGSEMLLGEHVRAVLDHPLAVERGVRWIGVDPAGHQRNDQTGLSAVGLLERSGLRVRTLRTPVEAGLRLLRARLSPAVGGVSGPLLTVDPCCSGLIGALESYRYERVRGGRGGVGSRPAKDGADHAVDALRYLVTNLDAGGPATVVRYL